MILFCLTLSQLSLATTTADVKDKAGEAVDEAANYTKEQKDAFVKEMDENLAVIKAKIKTMKEKTAASSDATLAKL